MEKLGSSRSPVEEREKSTLLCSGRTERLEEERDVAEEGERYKYPQPPTVT